MLKIFGLVKPNPAHAEAYAMARVAHAMARMAHAEWLVMRILEAQVVQVACQIACQPVCQVGTRKVQAATLCVHWTKPW